MRLSNHTGMKTAIICLLPRRRPRFEFLAYNFALLLKDGELSRQISMSR